MFNFVLTAYDRLSRRNVETYNLVVCLFERGIFSLVFSYAATAARSTKAELVICPTPILTCALLMICISNIGPEISYRSVLAWELLIVKDDLRFLTDVHFSGV